MTCKKAPSGWKCTRKSGHDGPCAAEPDHAMAMAFIQSLTNEYEMENEALKKAYLNPKRGLNPCESVREALHKIITNYERDINYIFRVKRIVTYAQENFT